MEKIDGLTGYDGFFAKRLRTLMSENKTTQLELANLTGITRQAISQYADGSVQPNIERLYKLSEYFDVSADYLLGRTDMRRTQTPVHNDGWENDLKSSVLNYLDKFLAKFNSLHTSMDLSEFITPFHIEIKDGIRNVLLNQLDFLKALERFVAEKDLYKLENDVNEYLSHISDFYIDVLLRDALENSIDGYQEMRLEILDSCVKAKKEEKDEKFYGNDNKSIENDKKGGFHRTDC